MGPMVRVRVRGGVLEPLEKLDLPEGKEVMITIIDTPSAEDLAALRSVAGAWRDKLDCEGLIRDIYEARLISTRPEPRL